MLREAPWIIRNGVGAVNPTSELVESTQRRGLLAIARLWGGGRADAGPGSPAPTELKEQEASPSAGIETGKGSAAMLRAG
jgi:hypothetical protein